MRVLGIESSCDETAAAVVVDGRTVLSNVVASQVEEHKLYGGVVPEIASRRHAEAISGVVRQALDEAGTALADIDAVAVTHAPGLIGALLVGVNFAKGLALSAHKPLVPVHHLRSHIAANYLAHPDLHPPFLCLVVSGGHSHIVQVEDYTRFSVLGRTRDDAAGECFDKAARAMGMPYPGGIHLDKLAPSGNPDAYALPHPRVEGSAYDFSFSGLKTAVLNLLHNARQKGEAIDIPDLCASFTVAAVDPLVEYAVASAVRAGADKLVLAGGVAANTYLRRRLSERGAAAGLTIVYPSVGLCTDNAAMVACRGWYSAYEGRNEAGLDLNAASVLRVGE